MPTVDSSERDNKETLFVKEEVTNDAEVFGEVVVDVEGSGTKISRLGVLCSKYPTGRCAC